MGWHGLSDSLPVSCPDNTNMQATECCCTSLQLLTQNKMKKLVSKDEIIDLIKSEKAFLKENFGVIKIGIFGSYAKDRQTADSDIDLLVEFIEPRFDWLASLYDYMEERLNKKIEIVRKPNGSQSNFFDRIEKEVIYA